MCDNKQSNVNVRTQLILSFIIHSYLDCSQVSFDLATLASFSALETPYVSCQTSAYFFASPVPTSRSPVSVSTGDESQSPFTSCHALGNHPPPYGVGRGKQLYHLPTLWLTVRRLGQEEPISGDPFCPIFFGVTSRIRTQGHSLGHPVLNFNYWATGTRR